MARNNNKNTPRRRHLRERLTFRLVNRRYRRFENAEQESREHRPPSYEGPPQLGQVTIAGLERARTQSSDARPGIVVSPFQDQLALVTPPGRSPTNSGSARSSPIPDVPVMSYSPLDSGPAGPSGLTEPPGPPPDPSSSVNRAGSGSDKEAPRPPVPVGPRGTPPNPDSFIPQDLLIGDHTMANPPPVSKLPVSTPQLGPHCGADIDCTVYSICNVEFGQRRGKYFFQEQKAYLPCGHAFGHQCLFWWLSFNQVSRGNCPRVGCITSMHECGHMAVPTTQPNKHLFNDTTRARIPWPCEFCESPRGVELRRLIEQSSQETRRAQQAQTSYQGSPLKYFWVMREKIHWSRLYAKESDLEREASRWYRKKWAAFSQLCWRLEASGTTGAFVPLVPKYTDGVEDQRADNTAPGKYTDGVEDRRVDSTAPGKYTDEVEDRRVDSTAPGGDQGREASSNEQNEEVGAKQEKKRKGKKAMKAVGTWLRDVLSMGRYTRGMPAGTGSGSGTQNMGRARRGGARAAQ
ncbi:hypothetical protein EDB81DRAFT_265155 [Dactylonectria macrodidyma]|uniref:Uncharacterized protein n=1 Tax=Dactylonectria macrodidyma TaxID=307937 RepID=A0A9P9JK32_9HYPO|nr:hypothetical protein EDB81DRAFT_265155 [Dactylonectria macrodidyma]